MKVLFGVIVHGGEYRFTKSHISDDDINPEPICNCKKAQKVYRWYELDVPLEKVACEDCMKIYQRRKK